MKGPEDFLIAEYDTLKEFRASQVEQAQSRFNFFLILVSSAVGVIALVSDTQRSLNTPAFFLSVGAISIALLYLGIVTFRRIIQTHVQTIRYTRGLNRIRRYFVERHPEIEQYLTFSTDDTKPVFGTQGSLSLSATGLTGMVVFINAILGCSGVNFPLWQLMDTANFEFSGSILLTSAIVFFALLFWQRQYLNRVIWEARQKYDEQPRVSVSNKKEDVT